MWGGTSRRGDTVPGLTGARLDELDLRKGERNTIKGGLRGGVTGDVLLSCGCEGCGVQEVHWVVLTFLPC